ncbi:T9SS-dependent M36 family metallopeptidase [Chryseobacterium sp. Ch-15]|uniref:T9SS-dependent M36 family metallopeptidase n=1 Tax=Chryseobacterium muglaense TaxID=2893752 RepID=A0A9Q3UUB5_9FLAO|nr:T9SS-dependent M36 family metallopeptidase [Chryseobacterium muglaense]MBD3905317.1 T9SS-dependent M36 family metallopeptidase [Chryseobacterium muglaense]MCC9033926.1 T9SS-dependent M36 family metallopeptidase [Chryseobacterium muglaense]MCM2554145.1 T9SS-dependent M36 family metallopeptidase [Chryseobacterium muglaense]
MNCIFISKIKAKNVKILFAFFILSPYVLFSQQQQRLINNYILSQHAEDFKKSDLRDFEIDNIDQSESLKGEIVKIQQKFKGYPIYNAVGTSLIKDGKIVYFLDSFVKNYNSSTSEFATITKEKALKNLALILGKKEIGDFQILENSSSESTHKNFVKQRLMFAYVNDNLRLAYEFSFQEPHSINYWNILVDAHSGEIISKENLNLSCNFHSDAYSSETSIDYLKQENNWKLSLKLADNASYNVFPLPIEAPTFGNRSIVSNPWILASSPEGWHSTGATNYTITRGNNVFAYEDTADKDQPGFSPDGGVNRNFDFPFSINGTPAFNRSAAITNLFYINNKVHDIFYQFGFTESARNFQQNNFGKGGTGNDYVLAESQDGGGLNNANFTTPSDGNRPLMQMYLWSAVNRYFFYNAPITAIPRIPQANAAQFGPQLNGTGVTGDVALASIIDGCSALPAGSLAGKIGLMERGGTSGCTFALKVKNAQNAGAVAAVIYNNPTATNFPSSMGGTDATITIPSVLITNDEGEFIKAQLNNSLTVNITLKSDPATAITPDGSFDNGIITHEYGHGISNRLTGNGYTCLLKSASKEQMGEGWSDFFALMLTNKPGDNASVPRSVGTYASGQLTTGAGFRPAKYSPDFSLNNYTYGKTNGMEIEEDGEIVPDVHSIGFIWASMLWDLHWQYAAKYGYSSDVLTNKNSGSARVLQLVTDALKLQACNPTFIDGRNAILSAEMLTTKGEDRCMIWKTFAKRGLGLNALPGNKMNINDQKEDFSIPKDCTDGNSNIAIDKSLIAIYPNPAKDQFFIYLKDFTIGSLHLQIYDMSGKLILSDNRFSPDARIPVSTKNFENGVYVVKLQGIGIDTTSKIIIKK